MAIKKYITKKGEARYQVSIWQNNRPGRSKTFRTKEQAKIWERRQKTLLDEAKAIGLKPSNSTFEDFFKNIYLENALNLGPTTIEDYKSIYRVHVEKLFGDKPLTEIT